MSPNYVVCIQGPTATGKSDLALYLARHLNTEIISADSRQFYREMSIGTAKPSKAEMQSVPHHFVDFLSVTDRYSAFDFEQQALETISVLLKQGKIPIVVGGSGLYIDAVIKGFNSVPDVDPLLRKQLTDELDQVGLAVMLEKLEKSDPEYFQQVDRSNPRRVLRALEVILTTGIPFSSFIKKPLIKRPFKTIRIGISYQLNDLYQLINKRCDSMLQNGLINEVASLSGFRYHTALQTIGYQEFFSYLDNDVSVDFAIEKFKQHSRNFARKQMSWLRRDKDIKWFIPPDKKQILNHIRETIQLPAEE